MMVCSTELLTSLKCYYGVPCFHAGQRITSFSLLQNIGETVRFVASFIDIQVVTLSNIWITRHRDIFNILFLFFFLVKCII